MQHLDVLCGDRPRRSGAGPERPAQHLDILCGDRPSRSSAGPERPAQQAPLEVKAINWRSPASPEWPAGQAPLKLKAVNWRSPAGPEWPARQAPVAPKAVVEELDNNGPLLLRGYVDSVSGDRPSRSGACPERPAQHLDFLCGDSPSRSGACPERPVQHLDVLCGDRPRRSGADPERPAQHLDILCGDRPSRSSAGPERPAQQAPLEVKAVNWLSPAGQEWPARQAPLELKAVNWNVEELEKNGPLPLRGIPDLLCGDRASRSSAGRERPAEHLDVLCGDRPSRSSAGPERPAQQAPLKLKAVKWHSPAGPERLAQQAPVELKAVNCNVEELQKNGPLLLRPYLDLLCGDRRSRSSAGPERPAQQAPLEVKAVNRNVEELEKKGPEAETTWRQDSSEQHRYEQPRPRSKAEEVPHRSSLARPVLSQFVGWSLVSQASLYYLHHTRRRAASARGARGVTNASFGLLAGTMSEDALHIWQGMRMMVPLVLGCLLQYTCWRLGVDAALKRCMSGAASAAPGCTVW